jgi:hypothetical protein
MSRIVLECSILAVCPYHGVMELAAGELWPARCKCGWWMYKATGIERHFYELGKEQIEAEYVYACSITPQDVAWLREIGVLPL